MSTHNAITPEELERPKKRMRRNIINKQNMLKSIIFLKKGRKQNKKHNVNIERKRKQNVKLKRKEQARI